MTGCEIVVSRLSKWTIQRYDDEALRHELTCEVHVEHIRLHYAGRWHMIFFSNAEEIRVAIQASNPETWRATHPSKSVSSFRPPPTSDSE